jgi:transcriptional regulator with XRE-family HTH domain
MPTIKVLRESKGWTQDELAAKSGVTARTISRLENTDRQPEKSTLRLLALALGVDPDELIDFYRQKKQANW